MANVIANIQKPTLVISHNKTLAAQLAEEFQEFFPENEVHYFVSYYDYYQPEAYIPSSDTYIEKETQVNEEIDRLRHAATQALLSRRDVIVVASVSCIYGLGSPEEYARQFFTLHIKDSLTPRDVMKKLVNLQYQRNDIDPKRGMFRCVGGNIDILQPFSAHTFDRVVFGTAGIGEFKKIDRTTGKTIGESSKTLAVFPATHYLTPRERLTEILEQIEDDMHAEVKALKKTNKILEAARLEQRTTFDLEMIRSVGYCSGIENYSRYFDNRQPSEPAFTLIDYFPSSANPAVVAKATLAESAASAGGPKDFLTFIDESHMTIPQINAMYNGDRARKDQLVQYGFRLKAAYDNRPLKFEEFEKKLSQTIFVSATPGAYEMSKCRIMDISTCRNFEISKPSLVVEQIIRPTGLLDPVIEVHPTENQIDNLIKEIQTRIQKHQRVLVTTLTKRMAEDLASHLSDLGMKVAYIHSEIETFDRLEIIEKLRSGFYDCLVGINLLREGLDLPEVSLVAILDADKEGFLRSRTAFLQIAGRASRHLEGKVIMYADKETRSMKETIEETERRRRVQMEYNQKHGITPQSIKKGIRKGILAEVQKKEEQEKDQKAFLELVLTISGIEAESLARELQSEMELASKNWEFEKAAHLRDRIRMLREKTAKRPLGKFGRLKQLAQEK